MDQSGKYSKVDIQISEWYESGQSPCYLHQGSQEALIQELKAWIERRLQEYKEVNEFREECQRHRISMLESARGEGWVAQQTVPDMSPKVSYISQSQVHISVDPKVGNDLIHTDLELKGVHRAQPDRVPWGSIPPGKLRNPSRHHMAGY